MDNSAYFKNIRSTIISQLNKAEKEVLIAMAWFTNKELFSAILSCLRRGVKVKLILLDDVINHCDFGLDFNLFIEMNGSEFFLKSPNPNFLHHKFCLIDKTILITGSYNWTNYAETRNLENIIISDDPSLVKAFLDCFKNLKRTLKQEENFEIVSIDKLPETVLTTRINDIVQEISALPNSDLDYIRKNFENKIYAINPELIEHVKILMLGQTTISTNQRTASDKIVMTSVENFKYVTCKYNIGFKANLIDQGGKVGLKVMIEKGQILPYTVTRDAQTAESGESESMSTSCEFFYGETTNLSKCHKLGETMILKDLPKMRGGK